MDKLEQLLSTPASHSDVPSSEQVRLWSEKALERWAMENQDGASAVNAKLERIKELVFGLGLAACLGFLLLVLMGFLGTSFAGFSSADLNLPSSADITLMMQTHSTTVAIGCLAFVVLVTRPLREFVLEQLD